MENVILTPKEQARLQVLNSLLAEHITLDQAAELMGISPRHTMRVLKAYRENGATALAHGLRGHKPVNTIPEATRSRVVHLAGTTYQGANHTHLTEQLSEREGIDIGRSTLRRILVDARMASSRGRHPPRHRVRRERMAREGMLIQLDGSHHRWLGADGPQFALLFAVDDATDAVVNARFCDQEDSLSYFLLLQGLIQRRGIPRLQAPLGTPARRHGHPVRPGQGGVGSTVDIRPLSSGKGTCGANGWNFPGPAGHRTPAGRSGHPGRGQGRPETIPAPV